MFDVGCLIFDVTSSQRHTCLRDFSDRVAGRLGSQAIDRSDVERENSEDHRNDHAGYD